MSWLDWLVVVAFGVIVLGVVGLAVLVAVRHVRDRMDMRSADAVELRSRTSHDTRMGLVLEEDEGPDAPFPETIGEEEGIRDWGSGIREEGRR